MNRFLAQPRLAVVICGLLRCTGGVLGCTAMAGAISVGAAASADAAARVEPEPRRSVPPVCRHARSTGDWYTAYKCREAWLAMYERSRKRSGHGGEFDRRGDRYDRPRRRPPSRRQLEEWLRQRPTAPDSPGNTPPPPARPKITTSPPSSPEPTHARSPESSAEPSTEPTPRPARTTLTPEAEDLDSRPPSLQPVLLLGLLLPTVAAICYPFRHRLYAAAGLPPFSTAGPAEPSPRALPSGYQPAIDPFATPALGLTGPGAIATARMLALSALDEHGGKSLVVIPRPDTTGLFGLAEDELLDDDTAGLFIPGNLDAALAYLETELAIRENTGVTQARRLLLVADPDGETARIQALLDRHPGGVSVVLLGAWTGDQASVDDEGLVDASPAMAVSFPERLPAMSRTEARDRLFSALARQRQDRKPPSKRRSTTRRP